MKKGYFLKRIIRSLLSVAVIMLVVFTMIYTLISRDTIFFNDATYTKLASKPDTKYIYKMDTWKSLGYLEYTTLSKYCGNKYGQGSSKIEGCLLEASADYNEFIETYEEKGYTIDYLPISKTPVAYYDYPVIQRLGTWFTSLFSFDHPWKIQDPNNPDLARKITVGLTETGAPAIKCSGCEHKYLLYTDTNFPYLHQNFITLDFGTSYPTYSGLDVLNVIGSTQGGEVKRSVTYETGNTGESGIIFGSLKYKYTLDKLDQNKFVDNYADYEVKKDQPSMVGISFIMGLFAMLLAYGIGLPCGLLMAKRKDKLADKLGMVYIIFIIAVPSLAYIYLFRFFGTTIFNLPSVFPTYGPGEIKSWVLPVVSLSLPSIAGLMLWSRRYIVDQSNEDYVKFAKAKGLNQSEIFRNHIFKNAIIPIAQGIPANLASCITGAMITESVYAVGGMGKMLPDAIRNYNNTVIIALTFIFSSLSVISVFLGDVVLTIVDPRISLQEKEGRA